MKQELPPAFAVQDRNLPPGRNKGYLLGIFLLLIVFLSPTPVFKLIMYLFEVAHTDRLADAAWFSYLIIRAIACGILIYLFLKSFRHKKSMLKLYAIVFLLLEIIFSFFSDSNGFISYETINWHCRYWHPLNNLGYRDHEPPAESSCQHKILTLGDSYTAGYALTNMADRFDQVLQKKLGTGWCTYCVAEPGVDSKEEISRLKAYPVTGNYIVFGYYLNDIDSALINHGIGFPDPPEVKYWLNPAVTGSAVLNFLFFRYGYLFHSNPDYYKYMENAFNNDTVMKEHLADLRSIVDYTKSRNEQLIVLVYPELTDLEISDKIYVSKMVQFFKQYCPTVISVGDLVKGIPVKDRVASETDTHPGIRVNQAIADTLFQVLTTQQKSESR